LTSLASVSISAVLPCFNQYVAVVNSNTAARRKMLLAASKPLLRAAAHVEATRVGNFTLGEAVALSGNVSASAAFGVAAFGIAAMPTW